MNDIEIYRFPVPGHQELHLNVTTMEEIYDASQGETDHAHRHDYYTILWMKKGRGTHLIDFNTYELVENGVFFVSPGQIHQVVTPVRPEGWVITFSKAFLHMNHLSEDFLTEVNLFNSFEDRPPLQLSREVITRLENVMQGMQAIFNSSYRHKLAGMGAYLKLFLVYCEEECQVEETNFRQDHPGKQLLKDFKSLVQEHFRTQHGVGDYAGQLAVSQKHLNQVVKSLLGQTAKEVIQEKIMLNAKRELKYSELSVKEIAYSLGYEEPLYFSAAFKKAVGVSPSAFRDQT